MKWLVDLFSSSLGRKLLMALTGLFLISFLIIHCTINAMIFYNDGGETFSYWGHFMGTNPIIRTLEIGLVAGFLIHIFQGLSLWRANHAARPVKYSASSSPANSTWYSRSMGLLGTLILLFLIIHLVDFWVPSRFGTLPEATINEGTKHVHNLYSLMQVRFQQLWIVIVYVLGCISLAYHLLHGFYSSFKTIGVYNKRYLILIRWTGYVFAILVSFVFAMMPISFYLGWVK